MAIAPATIDRRGLLGTGAVVPSALAQLKQGQ